MKKANFLTIVVIAIMLLFGANFATALEPIPKESGFSGFIRPGVDYMSYKTNMVASFLGYDLSEKKTDSLDDSPDSETQSMGQRHCSPHRCGDLRGRIQGANDGGTGVSVLMTKLCSTRSLFTSII